MDNNIDDNTTMSVDMNKNSTNSRDNSTGSGSSSDNTVKNNENIVPSKNIRIDLSRGDKNKRTNKKISLGTNTFRIHGLIHRNVPIVTSDGHSIMREWSDFFKIDTKQAYVAFAILPLPLFFDQITRANLIGHFPLGILVSICNIDMVKIFLNSLRDNDIILSSRVNITMNTNILHNLFYSLVNPMEYTTHYSRFRVYELLCDKIKKRSKFDELLQQKNKRGDTPLQYIKNIMTITGITGLVDIISNDRNNSVSLITTTNMTNHLINIILNIDAVSPHSITNFLSLLATYYIEYCLKDDKSPSQSFCLKFGDAVGVYMDRIYHLIVKQKLHDFTTLMKEAMSYQSHIFKIVSDYNHTNQLILIHLPSERVRIDNNSDHSGSIRGEDNPLQHRQPSMSASLYISSSSPRYNQSSSLNRRTMRKSNSVSLLDNHTNNQFTTSHTISSLSLFQSIGTNKELVTSHRDINIEYYNSDKETNDTNTNRYVPLSTIIPLPDHDKTLITMIRAEIQVTDGLYIAHGYNIYFSLDGNNKPMVKEYMINHINQFRTYRGDSLLSIALECCNEQIVKIFLECKELHLYDNLNEKGENILHSLLRGKSFMKKRSIYQRFQLYGDIERKLCDNKMKKLLEEEDGNRMNPTSPKAILDSIYSFIGVTELYSMLRTSHMQYFNINPNIYTTPANRLSDIQTSLYNNLFVTVEWINKLNEVEGIRYKRLELMLKKNIGEYMMENNPTTTLFILYDYFKQRYRLFHYIDQLFLSKMGEFVILIKRIVVFSIHKEFLSYTDFMDSITYYKNNNRGKESRLNDKDEICL